MLSEAVVREDRVYIRVTLVVPILLVLCELKYLTLIVFPVSEIPLGQASWGRL
jgi:hypothetical protein